MIQAVCHCRAASIGVPSAPTEVTECNCSICRRIGARWAYYSPKEVKLPDLASTRPYVWGDRMLAFHRCRTCGVVTHWQSLDGARDRMAINARLIDELDWNTIRIRQFDGGGAWGYLDED